MKFRKRPVVVEAWQWDGSTPKDERPSWVNDGKTYLTHEGVLIIPTLEGDHIASPSDWIIRGVKGELYPCKPDIFEVTYEPVKE
jgi:hypothetical protein